MNAASIVRRARGRAGLTQAEVAQAAGTSQPAVARIEAGAVEPELATLRRLLAACGEELELSSRPQRSSPVSDLARERRAEILSRAAERGARNVRVFGSVARGEDDRASDLDLLVDLPPGRTLMDLSGLSAELSDLLGVDVDVSTERVLKPSVRRQALREAVRL
jgi:predicted nucleotidyltransferase/DNA-binding XRE family transcriptional regulator